MHPTLLQRRASPAKEEPDFQESDRGRTLETNKEE
jgi:hypothetical protein